MEHTRVVQASRGRRVPRQQVKAARTNRRVGSRWRAAAVAMSLGCTAALSACGGGGGGDTTPAAPTQKAPQKPILIETYGDSTTAGWTVVNGTGQYTSNSEPTALQALLQARFGPAVTVSNQGVSGTEVSQLLDGTDGVHPTWANQMSASKAQIVTINFGLNDAGCSPGCGADRMRETPQDYANIVTQLIQIAQASGKKVVLFEPHPTCDQLREPLIPPYDEALKNVAAAQNVPIVLERDSILAMPNWQSMLPDCLHPGDALYAIKAKLEYPVLESLVSDASK